MPHDESSEDIVPAAAIRVNGLWHPCRGMSLVGLVMELGIKTDHRAVAIALNGRVVPRSAWGTSVIGPGDEIEIVGAVQGG